MEEYDRKGVVIMSAIDKLIEIANAEVGYLEKSSNSQLDRYCKLYKVLARY